MVCWRVWGLSVEQREFAEGINEADYIRRTILFSGYGKYEDYNWLNRTTSIADFTACIPMLSNFATVTEMVKGQINKIHVVGLIPVLPQFIGVSQT